MALRVPASFINVADAYASRDEPPYNVMGVCVDYLPPAQSYGTDLAMKINLWDVSCNDCTDLGNDGMLTRMFYKKKYRFPAVHEIGDIVIFRGLKTSNKKGTWMGLTSPASTWVVINGLSLLDSTDSAFTDVELRKPYEPVLDSRSGRGPRPTPSEFEYAKSLLQMRDRNTLRGPPKSTALDQATIIKANGGTPRVTQSSKFRLVKDIIDPPSHSGFQFVDLLGEVERCFYTTRPVELKISDYTEHHLLYDYGAEGQDGDEFGYLQAKKNKNGWQGPSGRRTITVHLWDSYAEHVRDLAQNEQFKLGSLVRIKNVHIAMHKGGAYLEGHLRGAGGSGSAIKFFDPTMAKDEASKSLMARIRAYRETAQSRELKSKRPAEVEPERQPPTKKSKNQKKRERKAQANRGLEATTQAKPTSNQHVRCEAINVGLTTITDIMDARQLERNTSAGNAYKMPFQNCKYRSEVQVVDFFPDKLEDFAAPYRQSDRTISDAEKVAGSGDSPESAQSEDGDEDRVAKWEWHFFLMVRDPTPSKLDNGEVPTMLLQVAGGDAEYLLNMEACDLRTNDKEFGQLKEKLFVLWGDLEEKKTEHQKSGLELEETAVTISSTPFECMIREFGIQAHSEYGSIVKDKWERTFGLFKTNIG
ncbi:hypothetical protein LTR05_004887 [Lithohypha guttulata]|uniref:Protection of telomeres protein 1 n=1 Tax=Lithohypha guttulata TaxID=1690604 RepID=A0AAN7T0R2_9EURO|nr:hypothetical protein LTR05_004887 [Lithohypha guttulata]